jgi:hypothetical protein
MSKKNRDDLAEERAELEQQRAALSQEVNTNTLDTPESQFSYVQSFKVCSQQIHLAMTFFNVFPTEYSGSISDLCQVRRIRHNQRSCMS